MALLWKSAPKGNKETMKMYELVDARDVFDDNNKGYRWGIEWLFAPGEIADIEWFKTKKAREEALNNTWHLKTCENCGKVGVALQPTKYKYCWSCREEVANTDLVVPLEKWIPF